MSATLTHQRRHESPELEAMVGRMLNALIRRCAEGDTQMRRIVRNPDAVVPEWTLGDRLRKVMDLAEVGPKVEGYGCPWCPVVVVVVDSDDEARRYMESHLDVHFAHAVGRPKVGAA